MPVLKETERLNPGADAKAMDAGFLGFKSVVFKKLSFYFFLLSEGVRNRFA